jgi:hypothetical protein
MGAGWAEPMPVAKAIKISVVQSALNVRMDVTDFSFLKAALPLRCDW